MDSCSLSGQGGEGAEGGGRGRKNDFMINVTRPADPPGTVYMYMSGIG